MKEEKVRIKVRLTEEEKEKLERNSALCGLTQSEYVRQLCLQTIDGGDILTLLCGLRTLDIGKHIV